jgi:putative phosphoesterase
MSHTVGVISDTHGLLRPELVAALRGTDLIIHAGDVGGEDVLSALRAIGPVHAVRGNCDSFSLGLPPAAVVEVGAAMLYVLHDLGRLDLDPRAAGFAAVISGHSHCPALEQQDGVLFLNPGSAGPRRFSLPISMARIHVDGAGQLRAELVELVP